MRFYILMIVVGFHFFAAVTSDRWWDFPKDNLPVYPKSTVVTAKTSG